MNLHLKGCKWRIILSASVLLLHEYYFCRSFWICPLGSTIVCTLCARCHTFSFSNGFFWPKRFFSDNLGLANVGSVQPGNWKNDQWCSQNSALDTDAVIWNIYRSFLPHGRLTDSINPLQLQKVSISFPSLCPQCERVTWANLLLCSVLCLLLLFMSA